MKLGYADTAFGQIHYQSAGDGPALLLLPGGGQTHRIFARQLPLFAQRFRTVAVDTLGSATSAPLPPNLTFEKLAESTIRLMDALGIGKAHIYGIHTGNKIGAALAANWPDRVGDFILAGQSHSIIADQGSRNAHMLAVTKLRAAAAPADPRLRRLKAWADTHKAITDLWWSADLFNGPNADAAMADIKEQIVDKLQSLDSLPRLYEANLAYDLERDLRRIPAPHRTLIVEIATPEEDETVGRKGPALLKIIPRSSLVTIEEPNGLGLTLDNRAAELTRAVMEFIG